MGARTIGHAIVPSVKVAVVEVAVVFKDVVVAPQVVVVVVAEVAETLKVAPTSTSKATSGVLLPPGLASCTRRSSTASPFIGVPSAEKVVAGLPRMVPALIDFLLKSLKLKPTRCRSI